jgi:hypothetical protein
MINFQLSLSSDIQVVAPDSTTSNYAGVTSFSINPTIAGIYHITITVTIGTTNYTFNYDLYLEPDSYIVDPQINIDYNIIDENPLECPDYLYIYHPCRNYITILYTTLFIDTINESNNFNYYVCYNNECHLGNSQTFSVIDGKLKFGGKVCRVQLEYEPGCCGQYVWVEKEVECKDCEYEIELNSFLVSRIKFFLDCTENDIVSVKKDIKDNICQGYCNYPCECSDVRQCKCIPINYPITLKYEGVIYTYGTCNTNTIKLYVNDDLVDIQTISNINDLDDVELTFENKGLYNIIAELTDCCGNKCIYEQSIIVGGDIFINTEGCPQVFKLYDYRNRTSDEKGIIKVYRYGEESPIVIYNILDYNKTNYEFSLNGNIGIFVLEYLIVSKTTNIVLESYKYLIYDVCTLYECYIKILNGILDEGCKECNELNSKQRMIACEYQMLFSTLNMYFDLFMKRTEGYYRLDGINEKDLKEVDLIINRMKKICNVKDSNITSCC